MAEGHHRHKKQSGGAGQFGEFFLRIEPLPRGGGFEFVNEVKGGTISAAFIPAVEGGVTAPHSRTTNRCRPRCSSLAQGYRALNAEQLPR